MPLTLQAIRDIIEQRCEFGYLLTDDYLGMSLIDKRCVEEESPGIYVARFRLKLHRSVALNRLVDLVCGDVGSPRNLFVEERSEYGIPFLECVWVLSPGGGGRLKVKD